MLTLLEASCSTPLTQSDPDYSIIVCCGWNITQGEGGWCVISVMTQRL